MEWLSTQRVNSASFWNSLAQWTWCYLLTRGTGPKGRSLRRLKDTACTAIVSTISALLAGDPGIAHISTLLLVYAALSRKSNFKKDFTFLGWLIPNPKTKSERSLCQKRCPVWHYPQAFPRLYPSQPWMGSKLASNRTGESQISEYPLFKKFTSPFSGLVIWLDRSPGRSPMRRPAVQQGRSIHCWPLSARPRVGRAFKTRLIKEGPLLPPAVWPQGVLFYKS